MAVRGIFVTGTDTGIGKTVVAALLLRSLGNDYSRIASAVGTTQAHARKLVQFARAAVQALE